MQLHKSVLILPIAPYQQTLFPVLALKVQQMSLTIVGLEEVLLVFVNTAQKEDRTAQIRAVIILKLKRGVLVLYCQQLLA